MSEKTIQLTPEGKTRLQTELDMLRTVKRQEISDRIQQAKAYGDISESGEYEDAKSEQELLERRIRDLESTLSKSEVIVNGNGKKSAVCLGCNVIIVDETGFKEKYTLVSSAEASSSENKISNESPLGIAMFGKKKGDKVSVSAPVGLLNFTIVAIE
jgi:transcription elongation factor GreA